MPALQIRDLPQGLYDELKLRAEREHRSLAQQATVAIEEHLRMVPPAEQPARQLTEEEERQARIAKRKAIFARIDAMPKAEIPEDFPTPEEIIRELRDSR
ncbi:MAG TPA: argininosuccinate lyase [Olsenella sp.]|nr:argininosuccinate lyase [Olsenella sp.]